MFRTKSPLFRIPVLLIFISACSCRIPVGDAASELIIMTWNVQNLFDSASDGTEYSEYDPDNSGWNNSLYVMRLENLSRVILSCGERLPDIILFQEVENPGVLEQLNREYLGGEYGYWGVSEYTPNAVHCGFLSRFEPENLHIHQPGEYGGFPLRSIQELRFTIDGDDIALFNNHWKSRSGGAGATESGRVHSAEAVARRVKQLKSEGISLILVAGDLNGSLEDYHAGGIQTAQVPVEDLYDVPWLNSLYIAGEPEDMMDCEERVVLYSPWGEEEAPGSYFFQNRWLKLDHILLTRDFLDGQGWEYDRFDCLNDPPFCTSEGAPFKWESWKGSGYSDHFPLVLHLMKTEG